MGIGGTVLASGGGLCSGEEITKAADIEPDTFDQKAIGVANSARADTTWNEGATTGTILAIHAPKATISTSIRTPTIGAYTTETYVSIPISVLYVSAMECLRGVWVDEQLIGGPTTCRSG